MNASIVVLTLTCLFKVALSTSLLPDGTGGQGASVRDLAIDGQGSDDERINYITLNGNGYTDNELASSSASSSTTSPEDGDADGLTEGLLRWTASSEAQDLVPRLLRMNPDLLDSLRAAIALDANMINRQNMDVSGDLLASHQGVYDRLYGYGPLRSVYPKRAPTGFTGMRGRRVPSGFNGVRGKKSVSVYSWKNSAIEGGNQKSFKDGKRAPSGFLGMRGKKNFDVGPDQRWRMDDLIDNEQLKEYPNYLILDPTMGPSLHINSSPPKRVPNGFMGLRGKKDCC
ncbi:uncharacterized protein LOC126580716 isoform X1 [Anopheles aquasalis]|uniref:uncharacterized protein LOC126580716 isoform X1 n=1 Tax=Anopheles aquasalis TaxID=42839 RepID=UPI00215A6FF1|nr:uncharacterized protein LOC126580716 isoform X1 [Anopheles aquasalis]